MKTLLSVLAVSAALAPGFALAQGCSHAEKVKMSCASGQAWDETSQKCSPIVGS